MEAVHGAARRKMNRLTRWAGLLPSRGFSGIAAILFAMGLLLAMVVTLGLCLARMQQFSDREETIQNNLLETIVLQNALEETAIATRSFVVERDPAMLARSEAGRAAIRQSLDRLTAGAGGDGAARAQLTEIRRAINKRLQLFDIIVAATRKPQVWAHLQESEIIRIRMARQVFARLAAYRDHERAILVAVEGNLARNARLAIWLALFTGLAVPLCALAGIQLLRLERETQSNRELQQELMHVQRLAIMGETAAMLAHEINQPLTAASNYLSVLRRHLAAEAPDKADTMAERIALQLQRAAGIVRKLRRFIEKRETEQSLQSPEALIEDAITLLGTIDNSIHLKTEIGSHLPQVLADRVQIQQVLVNLMRNAIEAMQQSPSRALVLSAVARDGQVEISLADSGPGLPPDVAGRLFEPFVTSKENGMGMGLSICRSIITQHGGQIWADPNPAGGTIFRFTLPAAEAAATEAGRKNPG
jgi:two-component system, LuxR family, sensor kinase FixL